MLTQPGRSRAVSRVAPLFLTVAAGLGALQLSSSGSPALATGALATTTPAWTTSPSSVMASECFSGSATPATCDPAALAAINSARRAEGIGPMVLPTNYDTLTAPEELFVVTDLERVDRRLAPIVGLTPTLDAKAQSAAVACCDPIGPAGYFWQSNWEGGALTALVADYEWMYNDGAGSNAACPPDCWAHRHNILGAGGKMGAGASGTSWTELFVQGYPEPPVFNWSQELPFLHANVGESQLGISAAPGTSNTVGELVYTSGSRTLATATLAGGPQWRLGNSSCWTGPGFPCVLAVIFAPKAAGRYSATLQVSWSGGGQAVPVVGTSGDGYWQVARDGGVFDLGGGGFRGSMGGIRLNAPMVAMAATPNHGGYWLAAADGGIFTFGDARYYGSTGRIHLNAPIVAMAATPDGKGYWLTASDGGVFSFGDARYFGSTGGIHLNAPVVAMATTSLGNGYWLVGRDGGVFSFGAARYLGSTGGRALAAPIVAAAATPDGRGYLFAGSDGGVFTFGDARYFGSTGGMRLNRPITGVVVDRFTGGYWLVATDGGVFSFRAPFLGSMGGTRLDQPVVGAAAS